jgi:plasmid stability protein
MATLRIPNVPESVRDTLTQRAKFRGLSLEDYIRNDLVDICARSDKEEVLRRIDERRASLPKIDIRSIIDRSDDGRF